MSAAWTGEFVRAAPGRVVEMVDHDGAVRRRRPLLGWLAAVDGDGVAAEPVALTPTAAPWCHRTRPRQRGPGDWPMSGGPTADELTEGARGLRRITAELADPESELTGTAATRHRIEGRRPLWRPPH
ncbi:MAG: hypothetical protein ACR2G2_00195 [Pseudonocardia sp.]